MGVGILWVGNYGGVKILLFQYIYLVEGWNCQDKPDGGYTLKRARLVHVYIFICLTHVQAVQGTIKQKMSISTGLVNSSTSHITHFTTRATSVSSLYYRIAY